MPTWTQDLAIGVPAIDEQHRNLFDRAGALLAAMKQRQPAEVRQLVQFLGEHCSRHFRSEEKLMREGNYPRLEEHSVQHAGLVEQFREIESQFAAKGPSVGVTLGIQEYLGLMVQHIRSSDVDLACLDPCRYTLHGPGSATSSPGAARGVHGRSDRGERPWGSSVPARRRSAVTDGDAGRAFEPAFIQHDGKQILRLNFRGLSSAGLLAAFNAAGLAIAAEPPESLRIITLLASALDSQSADAFKRYALRNRPHVLASAIVGTSFWNVMVTDLQVRGRGDIMLFSCEPAALDWLASR